MTKAQILQAVRYHANELSTDVGALLSNTGNLLEFVDDAIEQVVMDLLGIYPNELLTYEDVSMVAGTYDYTLTTEFWQILKIEKTVATENPTEMDIADQLSMQYFTTHDETSARPYAANIIAGHLYVWPIPSAALTNYIRVWGIRPEATTLPDLGPAYLPRATHRLIVLWAVSLVAIMIGVKPDRWRELYAYRLGRIRDMQKDKFQQAPRYVRESSVERTTRDTREKVFTDLDWP
jgi:hypothetical protein